jgi:hypothetical protein
MGRRGRRKQNGEYRIDVESDSESDEYPQKRLWSVIVQDTDNTLLSLIFEYRSIDPRFQWLGLTDIREFVNLVVFEEPEYKIFKRNNYNIEMVLHNFIFNIFDIMDLGRIPIINPKEMDSSGELIDPDVGIVTAVSDKIKFILFINQKILQLFSNYYI